MHKKIKNGIKPVLLPFLMAVFPSLFHYGNNVAITVLSSVLRVLLINIFVAVVIITFCLLIYRRNIWHGTIASFILLFFFNIYGIIFDLLMKQNIVRIEHYTLLPVVILLYVYSIWIITKLRDSTLPIIWNCLVLILCVLILVNLAKILPVEIKKGETSREASNSYVEPIRSQNKKDPDIYYIVLDEFSGFEPMREYWHYDGVDKFKQFLEDKQFFVAEQTKGHSDVTLYELATRLNYQEYPCCYELQTYFSVIADNRVMQFLKARGYTTLVFDQTGIAFPTEKPIKSDYTYVKPPETFISTSFLDEFGKLVIDRTMLRVFSTFYDPLIDTTYLKTHKDMLFFTLDRVSNLGDIPSPKFVYVHLLLPHMPFIFDKNGLLIASTYNTNWDDYLDQYIYSISYTEKMITNILSQADPERPPVIILQSDHGARNQIYNGNEKQLLKNFPEEYKTAILFTLYIPGFDTSKLSQNINPINTFPIVFNYLFDTDIPLK